MKRNFDNLEIGKSYVSAEEPNDAVKIQTQDPYFTGQYRASNGHNYYRRDGKAVNHSYDLTTEVTVTITPVEPPKPRECWIVQFDENKSTTQFSLKSAIAWRDDFIRKYPKCKIIHMREVVEGDK